MTILEKKKSIKSVTSASSLIIQKNKLKPKKIEEGNSRFMSGNQWRRGQVIEKINKGRGWFFEKIGKIAKRLTRLIMRKVRERRWPMSGGKVASPCILCVKQVVRGYGWFICQLVWQLRWNGCISWKAQLTKRDTRRNRKSK